MVKVCKFYFQLQQSWNSRSLTSVKTAVPTSTSVSMAATLCHPVKVTTTNHSPENDIPNTSTLPYTRNLSKNNLANNPNLPKSVSTWGPLHKPLHWKVGRSTALILSSLDYFTLSTAKRNLYRFVKYIHAFSRVILFGISSTFQLYYFTYFINIKWYIV